MAKEVKKVGQKQNSLQTLRHDDWSRTTKLWLDGRLSDCWYCICWLVIFRQTTRPMDWLNNSLSDHSEDRLTDYLKLQTDVLIIPLTDHSTDRENTNIMRKKSRHFNWKCLSLWVVAKTNQDHIIVFLNGNVALVSKFIPSFPKHFV